MAEALCCAPETITTLFCFYKFIYLIIIIFNFWLPWVFVAAWAFYSFSERGLLFVAMCGLLIVVASLVAEPGV